MPPDAHVLPALLGDTRPCTTHFDIDVGDSDDDDDDDGQALAGYPGASPAKENAEPTPYSSSDTGGSWARQVGLV